MTVPLGPADPTSDAPGPTVWSDRGFWGRAGQASVTLWLGHAATLASSIVVARAFAVSEFGAIVLAAATVTIISGFLDLTLDEAVVYHGVRADEGGRKGEMRGLLRAATRFDLVNGLVVCGLTLLTAGPIARAVGGRAIDPDLIRIASLLPLMGTVDGTTGAALVVAGKAHVRAAMIGLSGVVRLALVVMVVGSGSQAAVLLCYVAGAAIAALVQGVIAWREVWRPLRHEAAVGGMRAWTGPLVRFGMHTSITTTIGSAGAAVVPIVLARTAGVAEAGLVTVAMLPITAVLVGSTPLRMVLFPEQARMSATGNDRMLRRVLNQYVVASLAIGLIGAVVAFIVLPWLLPQLYSSRYEAAVWPARILLLGAVARLVTVWSKNFPAAIGRPRLRTQVAAFELVLLIALIAVFGRQGAPGAAWAISVAYLVTGVVWWVLSRTMTSSGSASAAGQPG
ncbi:MAG: hypothetical protein QOG87_1566 [Actinomycetota bacterium]